MDIDIRGTDDVWADPPAQGDVPAESHGTPANRAPVFLHTSWRSSGTWLWSRLSAAPDALGYYEPLHEMLADTDAARIGAVQVPTGSRHPALVRPYFAEFVPLLDRQAGGVAGYRACFARDDFFLDANEAAPALETYLRALLDHAAARRQRAVLKFCRSLGRIRWMQQRFPGAAHLLLMRNPVSQFVSARRQLLEQANPYFINAPLEVLARNAHREQVAAALAALDVERAAEARGSALASYRGHLAFWLLCAIAVPDRDIRVIDADMLVLQPAYRAAVAQHLTALTGRTVELGDARGAPTARATLPWLGIAPLDIAACHHAAHDFLIRHATIAQRTRAIRMLARATTLAVGAGELAATLAPPLADPYAQSARLRGALGEERRRRRDAETALAAVLASTSWRLTAPLRAVAALAMARGLRAR